jgi:ArsR family transcriptional regulator
MKDAAQFFKVLADEARLKMLWLLFNYEELCVCDIMAALDITQSKASRHLGNLRHAGLVTDRKEGLWSYYKLCPAADDLTKKHLKVLRVTLAQRPDAEQLLVKLNEWFKEKDRSAICEGRSACAASKKRNDLRGVE